MSVQNYFFIIAVVTLVEKSWTEAVLTCDWRQGDCLTDEASIKETCARNCSRNPAGCLYKADRYGIQLHHQCHCLNIKDCHFDQHGHCNGTKCFFGYSGPTCQTRVYDEPSKIIKAIKKHRLTRRRLYRSTCDSLPKTIEFPHVFRVNWITFKVQNLVATVTDRFSVTSSQENQDPFRCKILPPQQTCSLGDECDVEVSCIGDISSQRLTIEGKRNVCIKDFKISGCPQELYGLQCTGECRCYNGTTCHQITGSCRNGCEPGRHGAACQYQTYENLAYKRPAFQSSNVSKTFLDGEGVCSSTFLATADLAVDGNYNQHYQHRSCSGTQQKNGHAEWFVILDKTYTINFIRIYTHFFYRYGLDIYIGDEDNPCSQLCYKSRSEDSILYIECQRPVTGKTVCIRTAKTHVSLALCEVEIFKCATGFYGQFCQKRCDLCQNNRCDQYSGYCIDGCRPGYLWDYGLHTCQELSQYITTTAGSEDLKIIHHSNSLGYWRPIKPIAIILVCVAVVVVAVVVVVITLLIRRKLMIQKLEKMNEKENEMQGFITM